MSSQPGTMALRNLSTTPEKIATSSTSAFLRDARWLRAFRRPPRGLRDRVVAPHSGALMRAMQT